MSIRDKFKGKSRRVQDLPQPPEPSTFAKYGGWQGPDPSELEGEGVQRRAGRDALAAIQRPDDPVYGEQRVKG